MWKGDEMKDAEIVRLYWNREESEIKQRSCHETAGKAFACIVITVQGQQNRHFFPIYFMLQ